MHQGQWGRAKIRQGCRVAGKGGWNQAFSSEEREGKGLMVMDKSIVSSIPISPTKQ